MDALVPDIAIACIPEPMPLVLESVGVEGTHRRRPPEDVPVHAWRNRTIRYFADGHAPLETQALGKVNLADQTLLQRCEGPDLEFGAAVLRTDLHHLLGLSRNLHHLQPF